MRKGGGTVGGGVRRVVFQYTHNTEAEGGEGKFTQNPNTYKLCTIPDQDQN